MDDSEEMFFIERFMARECGGKLYEQAVEQKFFEELERDINQQELKEIQEQQKLEAPRPMRFDPSEFPRGLWDSSYNAPIGFHWHDEDDL